MTDPKPLPDLPTPRLFHIVLSYDVIVLADDLESAARLAERNGPPDVEPGWEGHEFHMLPEDVEIDEAVLTADGSIVTIEQCIDAGQAPYLRGVR